MKKLLFTTLALQLLLVLLMCGSAFGTDYYVTQSGAGGKDGKAIGSAWAVSDFNDSGNWDSSENADKIDPGDTVYFSGNITSQIAVPKDYSGTAGNYITLDGWEGGTCDPVANRGCDEATQIDNADDTSDQSCGDTSICILLLNNSYIIIQDFEIKESQLGISVVGDPDTVDPGGRADHVTVRRNYIHDIYKPGLGVGRCSGGSDMNYVTIGGALGDGNFIFNTLEIGKVEATDSHNVGITGDDIIFSYNEVGNNFQDPNHASNVVAIHTGDNVLVEYNTIYKPDGQACISFKEFGGNNKIMRFNKCSGCGQQGINSVTDQGDQTNHYFYGNYVFDSAGGIFLYRNYDNIHIWANILADIVAETGTGSGGTALDISSAGTPGDVYVYNNSIIRGAQDNDGGSQAGMRIIGAATQQVRVKNNIFYYNRSGVDDRQLMVWNDNEANLVSLEHNTYYSDGTPYVYYYRANRNLATLQGTYNLEDDATTGEFTDPGFNDPDGIDNTEGTHDDDFTLDGTNIDDGEDLSECFQATIQGTVYNMCYDDVLDPDNTDWTTSPPTVVIVKQDDYDSWERGAYAYVTATNTAPVGSITTPASNTSVDLDATQALVGSSYDADGDTCTYAWVIPTNTFKVWDSGTTYGAGDLVEDDGAAGAYYKSKAGSNLNHNPPDATYWDDAETQASPGTGTCDASGVYTTTLTVNDGTVNDPTPAQVTITVTSGAAPVTETWGRNTADDNDVGEDTDIRSGIYADDNDDTGSSLYIAYGSSGDWIRKGLFSFDLSAGTGTLTTASFSARITSISQSNTLELYSCEDAFVTSQATYNIYSTGNSWTGDDNGQDILLVSKGITTGDEDTYVEFSSEQLATYLSTVWGSGTAYFVLFQSSAVSEPLYARSEDYTDAHRPFLEITTLEEGGSEPVFTSITCPNCDGYHKEGDVIGPFYGNCSEAVNVTVATPQLTLENVGAGSEVLNYVSGSGSTSLNFGFYTVAAGDTSSDLDAVQLDKNGGEIAAVDDAEDVNDTADIVDTFPTGATAGSLASAHAIVIDTTSDTQTSWTGVTIDVLPFTSSSDTIDILLTLPDSAGYHATAAPNWPKILALISYPATTVYAYYLHQVTATTFKFRIYLGADYRTTGLTLTGNLLTAGGSFLDQAGNAISATYPSSPDRLQDDKTYVVAVPGTFTVTSVNTPGTYDHWVEYDILNMTGTEAIDTAVANLTIHILSPIGTAITDNWTIDEDTTIHGHRRIYNGTITDSATSTITAFSRASTGTGPAGFNNWMSRVLFLEE